MSGELRLRPFRVDDEAEARAAHAELAADEFVFLLEDWDPELPWTTYLEGLEDRRRGLRLPPDRVPASFLAADVDGALVGRVSIRHRLNEYLAEFGGHIGYGVRPGYRRRGYAAEILRQALVVARALGVDDVLVTCDDDNAASSKVIERAGGRLRDVRVHPEAGRIRRYWIS